MDIVSVPGVRFSPDRVELVKFLYVVSNGQPLPAYVPIKEYIDVYEDSKVWELMEEKEELYCFMKLKNKTNKSSRINRVTDHGTWKGQSDEKIFNGDEQVGSCRNFSFVPKKGVTKENRMVMHEYRLDGIFKTLNNDYVIVHIKRYLHKDVKANRHRDEHHLDEQILMPIQPEVNRQEDEQQIDEQALIPIQTSQPLQQQQQEQEQDEPNPLQQFALEMIPLYVDPQWEDRGLD